MVALEKENDLTSLAIVKTEEEKGDGGALFAATIFIVMATIVFLYAVMFSTNVP